MASKKKKTTPQEASWAAGESLPPVWEDLSPSTRRAADSTLTTSLSNAKTHMQGLRDRGVKHAPPESVVSALKDSKVTRGSFAKNLADKWDPENVQPGWYFGHNRRISEVAEKHKVDGRTAIRSAASMSPQNSPDNEFRAMSSMTDAVGRGRMVTDAQAGTRRVASLNEDEFMRISSAPNKENVSHAPDYDFGGMRNAGVNRTGGMRAAKGEDVVGEMSSHKVPVYDSAIAAATPDSQVHHEYEMRHGDQLAARQVNRSRARDEASGMSAEDPRTIRGVPDRVDLYGLMKGNTDPSDPAYRHEVFGERGRNVPDSWMLAAGTGQQMRDTADAKSPAKIVGSEAFSSAKPSPSAPSHTIPTGKRTPTNQLLLGMAAERATQDAAVIAREPGSQTNIPPIMLQEGVWIGERSKIAATTPSKRRAGNMARGNLEGLKEFRPPADAPSSNASSVETPGSFFRGYDNPLDTDSVRVIPSGGQTPPGNLRSVGNPANSRAVRRRQN